MTTPGPADDTAAVSASESADGSTSAAAAAPSSAAAGDSTTEAAPSSQAQTLGPMDKDTIAALQAALAAEHAALWAYGLVAAYDAADRSTISAMLDAHQVVRDSAADMVVRGGGTPVGPQAAYTPPKPVTDPVSARALALIIEQDCAAAWRTVIGSTDDPVLRGLALNILTDTAGRMVTWNKLAKAKKITTAFPGQPGSA